MSDRHGKPIEQKALTSFNAEEMGRRIDGAMFEEFGKRLDTMFREYVQLKEDGLKSTIARRCELVCRMMALWAEFKPLLGRLGISFKLNSDTCRIDFAFGNFDHRTMQ
jgi:hypothetical protein